MAKKKAKSKELATEEDKFPATQPDYMSQDSTRGQEGVGLEDLTIPRLDVIQDLSPQHKANKPEYIEGAEVGMLFNSVTKALYGDTVYFVPVFFRKEFVIWKSRNAGGGFMGAYPTEAAAKQELESQGFDLTEQDTKGDPMYQITDTAQQFGMIIHDDDTTEDIVMSMSKSKMKTSRQLNTISKIAGGDRFSRVYKITAVEEQNKQNQDYWNLTVNQLGFTPEDVYKKAEVMYDSISSGARDVNREEDETEKPEKDRY
ncbi:hypothetical protein KAR91_47990 [Candidatus Pacearchaeota archaeon]|nr:hypothetical protein [Candidatus Pacearchaeota archaeon]